MESLPPELLNQIVHHIEFQDLYHLSLVNRRLYEHIQIQLFQQFKSNKLWPTLIPLNDQPLIPIPWKIPLVKCNSKVFPFVCNLRAFKFRLQVTDIEHVQRFLESLMENSITELELGEYGNVKENMNQIFNCIPQMNRLEKLKISVRFQLSDFEMFQRALVHSNITELEFRRTSTGRQLVLALAAVLPKTKLKVLSFFSTNTGEKELKELASSLPHSSVTELNLTLYNFPDISHGFTNLKILSIWIPESAINIRWLFDALPHLCLSELECYSEIDIQSYPSLFVNLPKSQISKLSIPINHQYSDFICSVAQSKVRYLSVFSTEANAICKAISDTRSFKLESLRISDTVTSEGLEYLLQGLQVRELDLEFNEIGDAGLQVIEELISNTRIKKLNVLDSEGDCLILRNALQYLTHLQIDVKDIEFMSHIGNLKVLKIACDEALKRQIYRLSSKYPKTIIDFVESH